jgi:hypothetical protein
MSAAGVLSIVFIGTYTYLQNMFFVIFINLMVHTFYVTFSKITPNAFCIWGSLFLSYENKKAEPFLTLLLYILSFEH